MFIWFASLQLNDPDPLVWIGIYGAMAIVCVMAAFSYYIKWLMLGQFVVYFIYFIILIPSIGDWLASPDRSQLFDELAKMQYPYIEETREALGLLICIAVLAIHATAVFARRPKS
jgi:hypothetical protein